MAASGSNVVSLGSLGRRLDLIYSDGTQCHVGDIVIYSDEFWLVKRQQSSAALHLWKFDPQSLCYNQSKKKYPLSKSVTPHFHYTGDDDGFEYLECLREKFGEDQKNFQTPQRPVATVPVKTESEELPDEMEALIQQMKDLMRERGEKRLVIYLE